MRNFLKVRTWKRMLALVCSSMMICGGFLTAYAQESAEMETDAVETEEQLMDRVDEILAQMTLEDKIAQMIMPAIRTWDEEAVTQLSAFPKVAEALRRHQYGGIILFGQNVTGAGQVAALIQDLQANNLENENTKVHIPYFMAADEEGGIVVRLADGTRMTGSMAIGATGEKAEENAEKTGRVIGEEMAAAGFNVNFAPDIDVNNNPANPVIGTRSFSDDPRLVATLGKAWTRGQSESNVIATYKHFPGHGDTGVDSHIGTPSVEKTYDQIKELELIPFASAIEDGAEMIMTAHITYPQIDDEVVFGDGETKGYFPATMSKKMVQGILREELGYDGVVVTDALEMDAIRTAKLVRGEEDSTQYRVNVAKEVILAGVDILLIPTDLNSEEAVTFYDEYIDALEKMVEDGEIPKERIDESVTRILKLKGRHGILDADPGKDPQETIKRAEDVIGSDAHHDVEMEIAKQAITLLKNEGDTIPFTKEDRRIVFLGRQKEDAWTIEYALDQLREQGILDNGTQITVDYYYDIETGENQLHYTDEMKQAISEANVVVGFTKTYSLSALEEDSEQYQGIALAMGDTHASGGRFVLLSDNLPYDAARYQEADAILLAYMGSGLDMDPTARTQNDSSPGPYNANVVAAIHAMFGDGEITGTLPVQIPQIITAQDGSLAYSDQILYERGYGLFLADEAYLQAEAEPVEVDSSGLIEEGSRPEQETENPQSSDEEDEYEDYEEEYEEYFEEGDTEAPILDDTL